MRELLPYLRLLLQRRQRLLLGSLLMLATVLAAVGLLALSGWLITASAVTALLWAAGQRVVFDVYVPGGGIRFFALARTVSRYFERVYNHDTVLRLLADLRSGVFAALTRLDRSTLLQLRSGLLLNRLTADIDTLDNLYLRLLAPPLVALVGAVVVALLLGWWLPHAGLLAAIVLLSLLALTTLVCARHGRQDAATQVELVERLRLRLLEQFQGLGELLAYGALARHRQLFNDEEHDLLAAQRRQGRRLAAYNAVVTATLQLLSVAVLLLALGATATSGAVAVFMALAVLALGEAFAILPAGCLQFGATRAAAQRLTAEIERPVQLKPSAQPSLPTPASNDIRLAGVGFCYPQADTAILDNIDLNIAEREQIVIMGASGCGKSTLAELLAGLRLPTTGHITIGGVASEHWTEQDRCQRIACLTQHSDLFAASIADNLRIAAPAATDSELWRALDRVALATWVQTLPDGLATWIGESGKQVSGGQGRRLALARLLLRQPQIVILDEPFAAIDVATRQTIIHNLQPWLQARTTLMMCHDITHLPNADRRFRLAAAGLIPVID